MAIFTTYSRNRKLRTAKALNFHSETLSKNSIHKSGLNLIIAE